MARDPHSLRIPGTFLPPLDPQILAAFHYALHYISVNFLTPLKHRLSHTCHTPVTHLSYTLSEPAGEALPFLVTYRTLPKPLTERRAATLST